MFLARFRSCLDLLRLRLEALALSALLAACSSAPTPPPALPKPAARPTASLFGPLPAEVRFGVLQQLTFEGENAAGSWAWGGQGLVMQSKLPGQGCDQIRRVALGASALEPVFSAVSTGQGATTAAFFFPGDQQILYASTHLGGEACPTRNDDNQGLVWSLHDDYDLFKVNVDGTGLTRLTTEKGYDAEATVCGKDGSVVFTSDRDGDIDLYRMDADGKNVRRLTHAPGYDGGAFFNRDCSRIAWHASRPSAGQELEAFQALLAQGSVQASKLELYVANADGSEATQVTYLNAASIAPHWYPAEERLIFSSNYGDASGREFDLWAINTSGTGLERITYAAGFDGFPMFSPDGKTLAFTSNRNASPGSEATQVLLTSWVEGSVGAAQPSAADRVVQDMHAVAALGGRGVGSAGLAKAGQFIEQRFSELGLAPAGDRDSFRQTFSVAVSLEMTSASRLQLAGVELQAGQFMPLGFSSRQAKLNGKLVSVGYGIVSPQLEVDDYAGLDVKGKVVVVRRFVPDEAKYAALDVKRRYGDLRHKAWLAQQRGALAMLVVDEPSPPVGAPKEWKAPDEAEFPRLAPEGYGDVGLPALLAKREVGRPLLEKLRKRIPVSAELELELTTGNQDAFNLIGRVAAGVPAAQRLPGTLVIGAHYDHVGMERSSLAAERSEPQSAVDDNASGTAALLEITRQLIARQSTLRRDVLVMAFSAEELGLHGSTHFVRSLETGKSPSSKDLLGMIHLDRVGRLRGNRVRVLGTDSAVQWGGFVSAACESARVECTLAPEWGYGTSAQASFLLAGVPAIHLSTAAHNDYHKPSSVASKVNAAGVAKIAQLTSELLQSLSLSEAALTFHAAERSLPLRGDLRNFRASLGALADYAGPGAGKSGVLLGSVPPDSAAAEAGLRQGDVLVQLGGHKLAGIEDFMYVLNSSKPGQITQAVIVRNGKRLEVEVTFREANARSAP